MVAAVVLGLYGWAYFADVKSISSSLLVGDVAAIIAASALLLGFICYLWTPRKYLFWSSLLLFIILTIMSAVLIVDTGSYGSPFIALWMVVAVFAGVFGWYGLLPLFIASTAYLILGFTDGTLTRDSIVAVTLAGELPLVISYMIWHTKSAGSDGGDKAYRELAVELSQVANKSEVVINAIADGVIALNNKGVIMLINPAAQQIIGWGKQDALSLDYKSVLKLLDKDGHDLQPSTDPVSNVLMNNKKIVTNELMLETMSEKKLMVSLSISPVGQSGSGVIIVFRDITSEKAEEREQAEFISTASHEMRTPVATIEGYLGLALNPNTAQIDEKARDFITKAHDSAQHLGRLFADLLDISKAEDGRLQNTPKVVDVVAFTDTVAEGLQPQADAKGLRFLFKPNPDSANEKQINNDRRLNPVYYANVDNDHLREVIGNLVENAIKYTPQGDVVIDVTGTSDHVTISVTDSGIGIPTEDQSHLFQKFYRVDNSDTRDIGGTGLGLYLSRRLTETMGGRLWVESEYKKGSTFYIELPRISHEEAMRSIEADVEPAPTVIMQPTAPMMKPPADSQPEQQPVIAAPVQSAPVPTLPLAPVPAQATQLVQSAPTPVAVTAPPYIAPAAQRAMPIQQPPVQQPAQQTSVAPNTPLTAIEQNPDQYIRRDGSVNVPPR